MGAYQKSMALYQGDDKARLLRMMADSKQYEGNQALVNSTVESIQGVAKANANEKLGEARTSMIARDPGGQSLYQRFGGGGPKSG